MASYDTIVKEYEINPYVTVKLKCSKKTNESKTFVYINNEEISQCMFLYMNIPKHDNTYEYNNIDEAAIAYSRDLETNSKKRKYDLTPEEEFWGHCSNLQAWVENDYNPNILHSNISVPLLTKLCSVNRRAFDLLLTHLDEMWKSYGFDVERKSVHRKTYLLGTYSQLIKKTLRIYDIDFEKDYDYINSSLIIRVMKTIELFDRGIFIVGKTIRYIYKQKELRLLAFVKSFTSIGKKLRNIFAEIEKRHKRKEEELARRRFVRWERKIYGSSKGKPGILKYRKWLRELRDCNVSIVSDEIDYPAYIWSMQHKWGCRWNFIEDRIEKATGITIEIMKGYKSEGMVAYHQIAYLFSICSGYSISHWYIKAIVRYEDGRFELRHLLV